MHPPTVNSGCAYGTTSPEKGASIFLLLNCKSTVNLSEIGNKTVASNTRNASLYSLYL